MTRYQDQMAELERLRLALTNRLAGTDSETFNRRPDDGGWSAAQVLAHVIEAERRSLAYLRKKTQSPGPVPKSGFFAASRSAILSLVMRSPLKVAAPAGAGDVPERAELGELEAQWQAVRSDWHGFLEEFPTELAGRAVYKHPVAGRLSLGQALRFLGEHLRRHTGQIVRALGGST